MDGTRDKWLRLKGLSYSFNVVNVFVKKKWPAGWGFFARLMLRECHQFSADGFILEDERRHRFPFFGLQVLKN